jgi:hypothetical protein
MAEVMHSFDEPIRARGVEYRARVVGRHAEDGMWEGWFEFIPAGGQSAVVSAVESRQPEREHLKYWASGLSLIYAEGALERALNPITVKTRVVETPVSSGPAPRVNSRPAVHGPEAVLDPFEVGARSLDILAQELHALHRPRLMNIIRAYDLNPTDENLDRMTEAQLVQFIVTAVETRLPHRTR